MSEHFTQGGGNRGGSYGGSKSGGVLVAAVTIFRGIQM
jgi:hypothetical protein